MHLTRHKTFSYPGHSLVTLFAQFLCSDWSKFDRWVHAETLDSILKLVYFDSWSWQSLCQLVMFLTSFSTGFTKWNTASIKSLLLFVASLFIVFLVERCVACQSRKSDFGWHRFSPCLMRIKEDSSDSRVILLDSFQELHLEWYAWVMIVFDVCFFISNFM